MPRTYWPTVERFFGALTGEQHAQGVLLRHTLGGAYSATGQFADILTRPLDEPLLDVPLWLCADWHKPPTELEQTLLPALTFEFCAAALLNPESPFDFTFSVLADLLRAEAKRLWPGMENALNLAAYPLPALTQFTAQETCAFAQRLAEAPNVLESLRAFHHAAQLVSEALNVRRDLAQDTATAFIQSIQQSLGLSAATPEKFLGALVLSNAAAPLHRQALAHLAHSRALAEQAHWPSFVNFLAGYEAHTNDVFAALNIKGKPQTAVRFTPVHNQTAQALEMAERYLLADLEFKESWEVQRRGLLGQPEVISKTFGVGLVLEFPAPYLPVLGPRVSAWFETYAQNGFRYYPHPAVPPDADDLGLALRLHALSTEPEKHSAILAKPLRWLRANIGPSGQLPCWFIHGVEDLDTSQNTVLWGNNCLTVEANLLRGLLSFNRAEFADVIEPAVQNWLARWNDIGLGGNLFYGPLYALWAATELLLAYNNSTITDQPLAAIVQRFRAEASSIRTPQAAALALCLSARHPHLTPQWEWRELILKNQRYDGGWLAEPLFVAPTRGEAAAWYASQTVTTALCYHALKLVCDR